MTNQSSYRCEICKDVGFIITREPGLQDLFTPCKCQAVDKAKKNWNKSGLNTEQGKMTFKSFKTETSLQIMAKSRTMDYYSSFQSIKNSRQNSIALLGQVGSGKTHLSVALAVNLLSKGIAVRYMPYRDIVTKIKMNMNDDAAYQKLLGPYQMCQVLLIDDLFKGKLTDSDKNIMFEIVNYRYLNYKPMIISSEFNIDKLLDFDEAIGSRILEMAKNYTTELTGIENNYRLKP